MKVVVTVVVEVDRAGYDAEYGEHAKAEEIRAHVKGVVGTAAESAFENIPSIKVEEWN